MIWKLRKINKIPCRLQKLTAIWSNLRMALLLPVPQYAMASVYIPERRNTGSLSVDKLETSASASSRRAYIVNAIPTAKPRKIFSCWVSWAYWNVKSERTINLIFIKRHDIWFLTTTIKLTSIEWFDSIFFYIFRVHFCNSLLVMFNGMAIEFTRKSLNGNKTFMNAIEEWQQEEQIHILKTSSVKREEKKMQLTTTAFQS